MNQYIITFGFQDEDDYQIAKANQSLLKMKMMLVSY